MSERHDIVKNAACSTAFLVCAAATAACIVAAPVTYGWTGAIIGLLATPAFFLVACCAMGFALDTMDDYRCLAVVGVDEKAEEHQ